MLRLVSERTINMYTGKKMIDMHANDEVAGQSGSSISSSMNGRVVGMSSRVIKY